MAFFEDLARGVTPAGIMAALGTAVVAPFLVPAVSNVLRPAAKSVLRTGITMYRSAAEPLAAAVSELVTEAQLELTAGTPSVVATPAAPKPRKAKTTSHKRQRDDPTAA